MDTGDFDKCIRDMNVLCAYAAAAIFPTREQEYHGREHDISARNKRDRFYTFPVFVPKKQDGQKYEEWTTSFEGKIAETMKNLGGEVLLKESERFREIEETISYLCRLMNEETPDDTEELKNNYEKIKKSLDVLKKYNIIMPNVFLK